MRILLAFFSAKSANSTVFRIPILLVNEIFLCEAYRFQKTLQTSAAENRASDDGGPGGHGPSTFLQKNAIPKFVDNRFNFL